MHYLVAFDYGTTSIVDSEQQLGGGVKLYDNQLSLGTNTVARFVRPGVVFNMDLCRYTLCF